MYDELNIDFQLPGVKQKPPYILQIKDFNCNMSTYTIDSEGRLLFVEFADIAKEEYQEDDTDFIEEYTDMNYHGIFIGRGTNEDGIYFDFAFKFTDGKMVEVYAV